LIRKKPLSLLQNYAETASSGKKINWTIELVIHSKLISSK